MRLTEVSYFSHGAPLAQPRPIPHEKGILWFL
jgi:hypothetical protein